MMTRAPSDLWIGQAISANIDDTQKYGVIESFTPDLKHIICRGQLSHEVKTFENYRNIKWSPALEVNAQDTTFVGMRVWCGKDMYDDNLTAEGIITNIDSAGRMAIMLLSDVVLYRLPLKEKGVFWNLMHF
ncbi:hypothetical protein D3C71_1609200 [compost metagenome]